MRKEKGKAFMKKIVGSLPFKLVLGVVIGILVGQVANEGVMNVVVTIKYILNQFLCSFDHHRIYRSVYYKTREQRVKNAWCSSGAGICFFAWGGVVFDGGRIWTDSAFVR